MSLKVISLSLLAGLLLPTSARAVEAGSDILGGPYDTETGAFDTTSVINFVVGADTFYNAGYFGQRTNVANVEGGFIWMGHDVFDRSTVTGAPPAPAISEISGADSSGELDYHATMVGNVLAGTGANADGDMTTLGAGMAPLATLWSGAIATSFSTDPDHIGSFETSKAAFLVPYRAFFEGTTVVKDGVTQVVPQADVINSSWGYDDPAGTEEFTTILDGLAKANPTVTLVKSAGNSGPTAAPGGPGSGYNGITVGALGGSADADPYMTPASYTSSAPGDFYNPVTGVTVTGVRAAVDIAAPGDDFALAYYGGKTGSLAAVTDEPNPATDLFLVNQSGTSFASPVVAGGVALLKDVAHSGLYFDSITEVAARDTRVIKSVLMASATPTTGWDNGQHVVNGVVTTSQALDYAVGAGRLNLDQAALVYVGGTEDVPGTGGGIVNSVGWDIGTVNRGGANDYYFNLAFDSGKELDVSLNWFVDTNFDDATETAASMSFANLDLQIWSIDNGTFASLVAESDTLYNNTEFLRFILPQSGSYGLRVLFNGVAYEQTTITSETYGLAWKLGDPFTAVPEPGTWSVIIGIGLVAIVVRRRRNRACEAR